MSELGEDFLFGMWLAAPLFWRQNVRSMLAKKSQISQNT